MPATASARSQPSAAVSQRSCSAPDVEFAPYASATSRAPKRRPMYGDCGLSSLFKPNALPERRGATQAPTPTTARMATSCLMADSLSMARTVTALPSRRMIEVETTDYHTAGEPFRIVVEGTPELPGSTVRERREAAFGSEQAETVRRLLCNEPRGHADMYGCFVVPPDDDGADLGVLFWHKDGYSTACGHGTIALGAWAVDSGRAAGPDVTIDVPSGRVVAVVRDGSVTFRNVPSYVIARDVPAAGTRVDLSYGGAIYASGAASELGLAGRPERLTQLIAAGRAGKAALPQTDVYGTIFYEDVGDTDTGPHQRNVTVFADGEVDRSPCGSGTSARMALLDADGRLGEGRSLTHDSVIGTRFTARIRERTPEGIVTEVEGAAYRTGEHRFVLDPRDPVGTGFVLR